MISPESPSGLLVEIIRKRDTFFFPGIASWQEDVNCWWPVTDERSGFLRIKQEKRTEPRAWERDSILMTSFELPSLA